MRKINIYICNKFKPNEKAKSKNNISIKTAFSYYFEIDLNSLNNCYWHTSWKLNFEIKNGYLQ